MPYPTVIFNTIAQWENYVNTQIITNGNEEITGEIGNNAYNGAVKFVKQSPLNWSKAAIYSSGGVISLADNFLGVAIFSGTTPTSLTWGDNFYNEYVLINMTSDAIALSGSLVYYNLYGQAIDEISPNTAVNIFKASNDLWVAGSNPGGGTGSAQKQPQTYIVGTTSGAPTAGTLIWQLSAFLNSYVTLRVNRGDTDLIDTGDGSPYITKPLASDTLTIGNYGTGWNDGDILTFTLITP